MITKFQFSALFAQAWSQGMTISNITSGFCTTGVYPFNPKAILDKLSEVSSDKGSSSKSSEVITFSPEMIKKYEKRFENGYNIFTDKSYVQWLKKFHPDHLPPCK